MRTDKGRNRLIAGTIIAGVTIACAGILLRATFTAPASGADTLPLWSLLLAGVWALGGVMLLRVTNPAPPALPTPARARPVLTTLVISAVMASGSFVGGWMLLQIPATSAWVEGALLAATSVPLWITTAVALVAGAAEEVFFRLGFADLWRGAWRWIAPTMTYALITAATGNTALTLVAPVLGLAATASRELTGRWWAPIVVHAVWTVAMVAAFPLVF